MKIVIMGAGKVGEELCVSLAQERHDIVLIEIDSQRLNQLISIADITGLTGNGTLHSVQMEAGVETCDVFIAVSQNDETNIIGALTAKTIGAKYTIARVRNPEYSSQLDFVRDSMGISLLINPELEGANEIIRNLEFPSALGIERFNNGRINIVEVRIAEGSSLIGVKVVNLRKTYKNTIFCVINRNGEIIIPGRETEFEAGDHVHVTGTLQELDKIYIAAKSFKRRLNSVLIIGGGRITQYVLRQLLRMNMTLKVIESDAEVADNLANEFPSVDVICGDGTEQSFLREERISNFDAVVALTGVDEENLMLSIYAKQQGAKKTICKVNRTDLLKVICHPEIDTIITPRHLISDIIVRFVRARQNSLGSNIDALYRLEDNRVEALQFQVTQGSKVINTPIKALKTIGNLVVAFIARQGQVIFPSGDDIIIPGDRVVIVTTHRNLDDLDDILA